MMQSEFATRTYEVITFKYYNILMSFVIMAIVSGNRSRWAKRGPLSLVFRAGRQRDSFKGATNHYTFVTLTTITMVTRRTIISDRRKTCLCQFTSS